MPPDILEIAASIIVASAELSEKAQAVPTGANYTRRFAVQPAVKRRTLDVERRVASLTARVLALSGSPEAARAEDAEESSRVVMDGVDLALRRTDRAEGMIEPKQKALLRRKRKHCDGLPSMSTLLSTEPKKARVANDQAAAEIAQASFDDRILYRRKKDNHTLYFVPHQLRDKVHELTPYNPNDFQLPTSDFRLTPATPVSDLKALKDFVELSERFEADSKSRDVSIVPHPYEAELSALTRLYSGQDDAWGYEFMDAMIKKLFTISKPHLYKDMVVADEPIYIDDDEKLKYMIDTILENGIDEIAIDVEHHSRFSYRGFTCLVQLSTLSEDYIIDPHRITTMNSLNQILACPCILKILHGCRYDVLWLQSDFGVYLVNVFDTFFASSLLSTPGGNSLANLVDFYCQIKLNKKQQVSDWRVRPLSLEQLSYARCDTHFLLYIFHCMRNQLLGRVNDNELPPIYQLGTKPTSRGRKQLMQVLEDSRRTCLQQMSYAPPAFSKKANRIILNSCLPVKSAVYEILVYLLAWRDLKARALDVSPSAIVTDPMLLNIAIKCPRTKSALQQVMQTRNPTCEEMLTIITVSQVTQSTQVVVQQVIIGLQDKSFQTFHMPSTPDKPRPLNASPEFVPAKLESQQEALDLNADIKLQTIDMKKESTNLESTSPLYSSRIEGVVIDRDRTLPKVIVHGSFTTRTRKDRVITRAFGEVKDVTPLARNTGKKKSPKKSSKKPMPSAAGQERSPEGEPRSTEKAASLRTKKQRSAVHGECTFQFNLVEKEDTHVCGKSKAKEEGTSALRAKEKKNISKRAAVHSPTSAMKESGRSEIPSTVAVNRSASSDGSPPALKVKQSPKSVKKREKKNDLAESPSPVANMKRRKRQSVH